MQVCTPKQKYNTNFFYHMETGQPQSDENRYVAILQYMQNHDCSYEHAVQCLNSTIDNLPQQHGKHSLNSRQRDTASESKIEHEFEESLAGNGEIVPLTPMEMKQLQNYFKGNPQLEETKTTSHKFCQFISSQFTKVKRKMRCLRYLNPRRCWREIKSRRDKDKYKKIGNLERNSISQSAKSTIGQRNCWIDVKDDVFAEKIEEKVEKMMKFLVSHQELLVEVRSLSQSGLIVNLPSGFKIDETIRPVLLVKEENRANLSADVRLKIQQSYEIVALSESKFKQVLRTDIKEIDYAFVFITLFKEIQVLSKFKTINEKDVEDSLSKYNRSLIKSAFILTIKQGRSNIFEFTMANHHQQEFSSDEDNAGQEDINNHRSIIQEQDFLYQSMLNQHKFKQEKETIRKNSLNDLISRRQKMKQSMKEQPTSSEKTICFYFRTPAGSTIKRNFFKTDHFQEIYDWVECEDSIEFEDEQNRPFDLYEGYPPQVLVHSRSEHLQNIFSTEEECIRLIIRQK